MPERTRLGRAGRDVSLVLVLAVVAGGALAGCTGERPELTDDVVTTTESTTTTEPESTATEIATAKEASIDVFASEDADDADRQVAAGVDTSTDDIPVVFLVKARADGDERIEVHLPAPPAGSTGWVDVDDIALSEVAYRIEVGLSDHRLRVLRDDEVTFDEPVGIGCGDQPAPGGVYYLKELVRPPDPDGPYGSYAYGLSGFDNVLDAVTEDDGDDIVAIHGTDEPDLVGTDDGGGCILLENPAIERLVEDIGLPLGTPVEIRA